MCQGGLDPKYALGDLERQFKVVQQRADGIKENREPSRGLLARFGAWIARFHRKEVTHV